MLSRNTQFSKKRRKYSIINNLINILEVIVIALVLGLLFLICSFFFILYPASADGVTICDSIRTIHAEVESKKRASDVVAYIAYANPKIDDTTRNTISKAIVKWAEHFQLPLGLVVAVCHVESNFRAEAIGVKTKYGRAMGMMQVMWPVHKDLAGGQGVTYEGMLSIDGGIKVGCRLLKGYVQAEQSIVGGLKRFFSQASQQYILEKVMTSYLTFNQIEAGAVDSISGLHQSEIKQMKKLLHRK